MTDREQCIVIWHYMMDNDEEYRFITQFDEYAHDGNYDDAIYYFRGLKEFDRVTGG